MASDETFQFVSRPARAPIARRFVRGVLVALCLCIAGLCLWTLEQRKAGLIVTDLTVAGTPVTLYQSGAGPRPLVVVAHGFGGSRQMMDPIAVTLARQGLAVASFDFPGHGRNAVPLSPEVTVIEGTTMQLVETTRAVLDGMQARDDTTGPAALVGHSMATDVIIRAAEERDDIAAVAAISMYSEAITATHPQRLLIVSGASEGHLRDAGLRALAQIDAEASEGETVESGDVARRAVHAPWVGHVGVLYAPTTLDEVSRWVGGALGATEAPALDTSGWIAGLFIVLLAVLAWPLARLLPAVEHPAPHVPRKLFWILVAAPIVPTVAVMLLGPAGLAGYGGFAALACGFAIWGAVQLVILWRTGYLRLRTDALGNAVFVLWGLGVFALALDHYGAAFLPTGPRLQIMLALALATVPFMLADAHVVAGGRLWRSVVARAALVISFAVAMGLAPTTLGVSFTVLPVLVLFYLVYGSLARWIAGRRGPVWPGAGLALAWAVAASTPLFAVAQ